MGQTDLGFDSNIRIGATVATMQTVKIEPHVEFMDTGEIERVVCGKTKATGYARCRWTYPDRELTGEQYYQLRNLVGADMSVSVVIDTPTNEVSITTYGPVIGTYTAIMHWPEEGVMRTRYNRWEFPDDGILFTNLEPV